jgi:hypothetical protein
MARIDTSKDYFYRMFSDWHCSVLFSFAGPFITDRFSHHLKTQWLGGSKYLEFTAITEVIWGEDLEVLRSLGFVMDNGLKIKAGLRKCTKRHQIQNKLAKIECEFASNEYWIDRITFFDDCGGMYTVGRETKKTNGRTETFEIAEDEIIAGCEIYYSEAIHGIAWSKKKLIY